MTRYYHVIKKHGKWHLYAGNAITALMAEPDRATVIKAGRALARHDGARVVVHKDPGLEIVQAGASQLDSAVTRTGGIRSSVEKLRPIWRTVQKLRQWCVPPTPR